MGVIQWMKGVNDGMFQQYIDNVSSLKLNGSDLMNLTAIDMQTKLEISIPNHRTTLSASIERLKKKSRRRIKSPNSPYRNKSNPESPKALQLDHLDDIHPNNKKIKAKDDIFTVSLNTKSNKSKRPMYHKSKSVGYRSNAYDDEKKFDQNINRANTVFVSNDQLKRQMTSKNQNNKKKLKNIHKDLGKKLWPNETSMIVKEGWMKKRGVKRTAFKERWCCLRENGHLYYFEKRPGKKGKNLPQGLLDLNGVIKIEYLDDGIANTFVLKTQDRDWIFSAMSGGQLVEWMSCLNKIIETIHN